MPTLPESSGPGAAVSLDSDGNLPPLDGRHLTNTSDYAGSFEAASISAIDVPDGKWGWWWDTGLSQMKLVRNRGGSLYMVTMT